MNDSPLIKIRKASLEWAELTRWCNVHLTKYRQQLESESTPVEKVPGLRAKIAQLKALLNANTEDHNDEQS